MLKANKETVALVFSTIALIASFGKQAVDFVVPQDHLVIVVGEPLAKDDVNDNPLPVSKIDDKLRLDPRLHISFFNSGDSTVLIRSVSLVSPKFESKDLFEGESCESKDSFEMPMFAFQVNFGESKQAVPFSVAPGEIIPLSVDFAGIPDIQTDVSLA